LVFAVALLQESPFNMQYMCCTQKHSHVIPIYTVYKNKQTHLAFAEHITLVLVDEVLGKFRVSTPSCTV
ncbi:MAG: hypothetical protein MPL62_14135, partial [Alphaproteobacteria bacterium]|nr:hypothetical protein [Alphaproteobacteria bacterium]